MRNEYTWQAFEVEDIGRRENYVFVYNPYDQSVEMYDTSIINKTVGRYKRQLKMRCLNNFPFECETAYDYYKYLHRKSVTFEDNNDIYFLAEVHPKTFRSLVDMKKRKSDEGVANTDEIKKTLRLKHKEFCKSIKNWELRKIFRKHTYIAGGAVASLIKGETPKDYDIFFDDVKALNKILKYYVDNHNLRYEGTNSNYKLSINSDENKIGLFLNTNKEFVKSGEENNAEMNPVVFSRYAVTFPKNYQIIIDSDNEKSKSVDRFDFVHSMGYFHPYKNKLFVKEMTLEAIKQNKLVYNSLGTNPIGSAKRLLRFIKRGWDIDNKEHMKILKRISQVDNDNVFDLEGENYFF